VNLVLAPAQDDELTPEDVARLFRRLLAERGLDPDALTLSAADVSAAMADAHALGVRVGWNERAGVRRCRLCGCTELRACEDVCAWVGRPGEPDDDLCTSCADPSGLVPPPALRLESPRP
jgi:hypothetical protein